MYTRKTRLVLTALAVLLPGPWTPVLVLIYVLGRAADPDTPDTPAASDVVAPDRSLPRDPYAPPDTDRTA